MKQRIGFLVGLALIASCYTPAKSVAEELAAAPAPLRGVESARQYMVVAANPLAAKAGKDVLHRGGTAIDAAVAVQMVLNLVEPQGSGIGGGSFAVYYDSKAERVTTFDGRETAPAKATPDLFIGPSGDPLPFYDAVVGGRSVGTPGTLRLLWDMHQRYGALPWNSLFDRAIELSETGFPVSQLLALMISFEADSGRLRRYTQTREYFYPGGHPLQQGDRRTNPAFAETLRLIAHHGPAVFYSGEIAADIVEAVTGATDNPGLLGLEDLDAYRVIERPPVCISYHGDRVCGMGPPSSGGLTVAQTLKLVEPFELGQYDTTDARAWHLFLEASKLAFADRNHYVADPDFEPVPTLGLTDTGYLRERSASIHIDRVLRGAQPGTPPVKNGSLLDKYDRLGSDTSRELPSTTHFVIVDGDGNGLSMTSSIENNFGSRLMVRGFLLNNQLTDFSPMAEINGALVANRVERGKRPRSSMSPSIVLDENGKLKLLVGSPGGSLIIPYVAKTLVGVLDWNMPLQEAITLPNVANRNGPTSLEQNTLAERLAEPLEQLGHTIVVHPMYSDLMGILIDGDGTLWAGADPRGEGIGMGE